jgi:hypothetical protein
MNCAHIINITTKPDITLDAFYSLCKLGYLDIILHFIDRSGIKCNSTIYNKGLEYSVISKNDDTINYFLPKTDNITPSLIEACIHGFERYIILFIKTIRAQKNKYEDLNISIKKCFCKISEIDDIKTFKILYKLTIKYKLNINMNEPFIIACKHSCDIIKNYFINSVMSPDNKTIIIGLEYACIYQRPDIFTLILSTFDPGPRKLVEFLKYTRDNRQLVDTIFHYMNNRWTNQLILYIEGYSSLNIYTRMLLAKLQNKNYNYDDSYMARLLYNEVKLPENNLEL